MATRQSYEMGGWFDGRLEQAYDLTSAVRDDHPDADAELRSDLQKAIDLTEEVDAELERLAKVDPA